MRGVRSRRPGPPEGAHTASGPGRRRQPLGRRPAAARPSWPRGEQPPLRPPLTTSARRLTRRLKPMKNSFPSIRPRFRCRSCAQHQVSLGLAADHRHHPAWVRQMTLSPVARQPVTTRAHPAQRREASDHTRRVEAWRRAGELVCSRCQGMAVSVQVPPTVRWQPRSLGAELVEDGEEGPAQCLADVCRQEPMAAEAVAPSRRGHLLGEQPMRFPAQYRPGRPLARPGARNAAIQ